MFRQTLAAIAIAGLTVSAAHAAQLTVEEIDADARQITLYQCPSQPKPIRVSYWHASNGQSFALVPVDGQQLLFVDTVSASGVHYQAGRYTWLVKGKEASLRDEIADAKAPPLLAGCVEVQKKKKKLKW